MPIDTELTVTLTSFADDRATVTLAGRFDVAETVRVREFFARPEVAGASRLVIDLTDVTFIDSAGLAVLARARRDRALIDGSVTLIRPASDDAMRVFRLTQFDQIFTMLDTLSSEDD